MPENPSDSSFNMSGSSIIKGGLLLFFIVILLPIAPFFAFLLAIIGAAYITQQAIKTKQPIIETPEEEISRAPKRSRSPSREIEPEPVINQEELAPRNRRNVFAPNVFAPASQMPTPIRPVPQNLAPTIPVRSISTAAPIPTAAPPSMLSSSLPRTTAAANAAPMMNAPHAIPAAAPLSPVIPAAAAVAPPPPPPPAREAGAPPPPPPPPPPPVIPAVAATGNLGAEIAAAAARRIATDDVAYADPSSLPPPAAVVMTSVLDDIPAAEAVAEEAVAPPPPTAAAAVPPPAPPPPPLMMMTMSPQSPAAAAILEQPVLQPSAAPRPNVNTDFLSQIQKFNRKQLRTPVSEARDKDPDPSIIDRMTDNPMLARAAGNAATVAAEAEEPENDFPPIDDNDDVTATANTPAGSPVPLPNPIPVVAEAPTPPPPRVASVEGDNLGNVLAARMQQRRIELGEDDRDDSDEEDEDDLGLDLQEDNDPTLPIMVRVDDDDVMAAPAPAVVRDIEHPLPPISLPSVTIEAQALIAEGAKYQAQQVALRALGRVALPNKGPELDGFKTIRRMIQTELERHPDITNLEEVIDRLTRYTTPLSTEPLFPRITLSRMKGNKLVIKDLETAVRSAFDTQIDRAPTPEHGNDRQRGEIKGFLKTIRINNKKDQNVFIPIIAQALQGIDPDTRRNLFNNVVFKVEVEASLEGLDELPDEDKIELARIIRTIADRINSTSIQKAAAPEQPLPPLAIAARSAAASPSPAVVAATHPPVIKFPPPPPLPPQTAPMMIQPGAPLAALLPAAARKPAPLPPGFVSKMPNPDRDRTREPIRGPREEDIYARVIRNPNGKATDSNTVAQRRELGLDTASQTDPANYTFEQKEQEEVNEGHPQREEEPDYQDPGEGSGRSDSWENRMRKRDRGPDYQEIS